MPDWLAALLSIGGGFLASEGSEDAANAAERAGREALRFQREAFRTGINLARPSLEVGVSGPNSALGQLASIFGLNTPSEINFDGLGGGGSIEGARAQGLSIIPGATWQNRPVFTDGQGGIYSVRGKDGTLERNGLSFLGQATEGPLRFDGKAVKGGGGTVVSLRDGEFRRGRGNQAEVIPIESPQTPSGGTQGEFTVGPGGEIQRRIPDPTGAPATSGPDLDALVNDNPLIRFTRQQGEEALARRQSALGLSQSTPGMEGFIEFNQGLASAGIQDFVLNPLFQLAGFGQQGSSNLAGAAQNFGNNAANISLNTGNARASSFQNQGNILGNTVSDIGNAIFLRNLLRPGGG